MSYGVLVMQALHIGCVKQKGSLSFTGSMEQLASSWMEVFARHKISNVTGTRTSLSLNKPT